MYGKRVHFTVLRSCEVHSVIIIFSLTYDIAGIIFVYMVFIWAILALCKVSLLKSGMSVFLFLTF